MSSDSDAPCVAVIGPASAGKTTLLHQLDEKLKGQLDSFMVIQGTPDGTGRYLYYAPDLRDDPEFKMRVKGQWGSSTIDRICEFVSCGRRNLSLAILDFGGCHDERTAAGNARMLAECSHYLLVSRDEDTAGADLWDKVGAEHGLIRLGWMRSLPHGGPAPAVIADSLSAVEATFQVRAEPGDGRNDVTLKPLVEKLHALSRPVSQTPYINLFRPHRWDIDMISNVAGERAKIEEFASRTGVVVVGGSAPVWAYLAALRCALRARPDTRVFFFDPKQPQRLVEIPSWRAPGAPELDNFPVNALAVSWRKDGERWILDLQIRAGDKLLSPQAAQNLAGAPSPLPAPSPDVALSGRPPLWVFGTYARWLIAAGVQRLASWDAGTESYVQVWS